MLSCGLKTQTKKGVHSSRTMKLLLEALFAALVLMVVLVSMVALANYHEQTIIKTPPPATQNFAVVASEDGESYELVEWDASCEVWGVQSESDIEVNFSEFEAEACRLRIRPLVATSRHPGVRPTDGHRAAPSSENLPSRHFSE
jgi:hypothetical protein